MLFYYYYTSFKLSWKRIYKNKTKFIKFIYQKKIQTEQEIYHALVDLHNTLDTQAFFVIHSQTNMNIFSSEVYYVNKNIELLEFTSFNFLYNFLQSETTNRYPINISKTSELIKIQDNYIPIIYKPEFNMKIILVYNLNLLIYLLNQKLIITFSFFLIILLLPFVFFNFVYKKYYKNRIQNIVSFVEDIKKANFNARIPIQGQDEISYISLFLNHLAELIEKIIFFDSLTEVYNRYGFELLVNQILMKVESGILFFMD